MKLFVDVRYTRIGFHDGISRYTASLLTALKDIRDSDQIDELELTMIISDRRQLAMLPDLPWVKICSPTGPLEPCAALMLNKYRPDVVFSPMQTIGSLGRRFKLVLTLHDLIYYAHPTPPSFLPAPVRWGWRVFHRSYTPQRMLLNRADAVATVSQTTAQLISQHHLTRRPVHVIANAAPEGSIVDEAEALNLLEHRDQTLLYMGSFMPYKNVETLIEAMRELPEYTLMLLSKAPTKRLAQLRQMAGANVVFRQGVSDKEYRKLLQNSHALMTASRDEGYGLPVVEAQAAGCPAIISEIPIFNEIAPHALHCSPDHPAEFVAAVRSLEHRDCAQRVVRGGLKDAGHYTWRKSARRLLQLVQTL